MDGAMRKPDRSMAADMMGDQKGARMRVKMREGANNRPLF
jgi:hypothetical protein